MSQSMLEIILFVMILAIAVFIGSRAKKGDEKAQKTAGILLGIFAFARKYFVIWLFVLVILANWLYGQGYR